MNALSGLDCDANVDVDNILRRGVTRRGTCGLTTRLTTRLTTSHMIRELLGLFRSAVSVKKVEKSLGGSLLS